MIIVSDSGPIIHLSMIGRTGLIHDLFGEILIPGVVAHTTNIVEHPELVAMRLKNYASVVGRENVIAGTDCGFSQGWNSARVHPQIQWGQAGRPRGRCGAGQQGVVELS